MRSPIKGFSGGDILGLMEEGETGTVSRGLLEL